jgi:general stress protein 26
MDRELVDEAFSHIGPTTVGFLATCEGGQPHVRAMTLIRRKNRLFFTTGTENAKVREAAANPRAEVCVMMGNRDNEGSVRLTGTIGVVHDAEVKEDVFNCVGFAESFWQGPGDPNYTLLEFKPCRLQYMRPGTVEILSTEI